ncbi:MAG: DUF3179 domain-containing protein [Flavobacteriaceae bacterium]
MKNNLFLLSCALVLFSCSSSSTQETSEIQNPEGGEPNNFSEWSIPINDVFDGGPGKDGIPALVNPSFVEAQGTSVIKDSDLVLGFKNGDDIRAYQHLILDWHEIINDKVGDVALAVTYCPLTGTGIGWNRNIKGTETTFGVSGLLYNTNLIPYDRATNSNWAQILNESVNGSLLGEKISLIKLVETDWKTWKALYPSTKVVGLNTGFSRTYGVSPYGDYSTNNNRFLFPVSKDGRLPSKERVHAVVEGEDSKVYRFGDFTSTNLFKDSFQEKDYLIIGNENFIVSFELNEAQNALEYDYVYDGSSDIVAQDSEGNQFTIFGEVVSGPDTGTKLKPSASFMAYWFSIPAFYETEIYSN